MTDAPKGRFAVRIAKAGQSRNGNFYPDRVLREAAPLFNGVRVFVKSDAEHLAAGGKDVRNLIGRIVNPSFKAGTAPDTGELSGEMELLDPSDAIGRKLLSAHERGMSDLFGLSIDAGGKVKPAPAGKGRVVEAIDKVNSVDLIVEPSAGGAVFNLIEALEGGSMATLKPADVSARVNKTKLPELARKRVVAMFDGQDEVDEARLIEAITFEADYLGALSDSGKVKGLGDLGTVEVTDAQEDKHVRMLEAVMDPGDRSALSIRDAYIAITGDKALTGQVPRKARLTEAHDSSQFPELLGGVIEKRVLSIYNQQTIFSLWRKLVNVVPASDFRQRKAVTIGGFGDLPKVTERGPYLELNDLTENPEAYQVEKRGGTADATLEMIVNDNTAMIQQIPQKLGIAAQRTVSKFVFDLLRTNPVLSDDMAAFHVDRGNLGSAALAKASLAAGRLAMKHQVERDSGERLGIPPRFLVVPDELEEAAYDLFKRGTENDLKFIERLALEVVPVWYWTDASDWLLTADPALMPSIEIGFLRGQQEPEIFIQDQPNMGSMFANDTITYKVRHIYGGCIADPRGLYKSVVA